MSQQPILRQKTALSRSELSRPMRVALEYGIIRDGDSIFDYGCGLGGDIERLSSLGYQCGGWDPFYRPDATREEADVVSLSYVINVIENADERVATILKSWSLARKVLVVAARTRDEFDDLISPEVLADGHRTQFNTFQKFYSQTELRNWVDQALNVSSVAAAPGIFFVFRNEEDRQSYIASRYRRALSRPRIRISDQLYSEHETLLAKLEEFVAMRGRLPMGVELPTFSEIEDQLGSVRKAFRVIRTATGQDQWEGIAASRREDLIVYLALSRFDRNARWSLLPMDIQYDVRSFFGTYKRAMEEATSLLFHLGKSECVDEACRNASIGKLTPTALYVHKSAIGDLSPLLRVFEGSGRGYLGEVERANLIKLYRHEPKISYLAYPDFDDDPHPKLDFSLNINLSSFAIKTRRFRGQPNRPILHRKELFVGSDHPAFDKFRRLTEQEERHGLLEDGASIGLEKGWQSTVEKSGWTLRGHRLIRAHR